MKPLDEIVDILGSVAKETGAPFETVVNVGVKTGLFIAKTESRPYEARIGC